MMQPQPPRDEVLHYIERIYRHRMTTTSGGNLSLIDEEGTLWITPARIDKGDLRRDDIVSVRGQSVDGSRSPSSEMPFHKAIYAARPDLKGIVHAHPVALVAFSLCRKVPETRLFAQGFEICGEVGFAPYALPGSEALGKNIADIFAAGHNCVILENHGVVVGGATLREAFERFETLEFMAKTLIKASILGTVRPLTDEQLQRSRYPGRRLSRGEIVLPGTQELEIRRQMCEFVRRAYRQRLIISTEGSFSARTGNDSFVITPSRSDRALLDPHDLVSVKKGEIAYGTWPSRASRLHRELYRAHPWATAIVNAFPVNATAFSVTDQTPDVCAIPESYVVLRTLKRVSYGAQFDSPGDVANLFSETSPAAIMENDGVLILGKSVLEVFDRLEVLEATSEAIINSQPLGGLQPMPQSAITELEAAFFAPKP